MSSNSRAKPGAIRKFLTLFKPGCKVVLAKLAPPQPKQYPSFTNTKDSHSQNPEIEIRCYMEQLFLRMSGRSTSLIAGLISSLCLGRKLFWNTRGTMPAQLTSLYMENLAGILPHGFTTCRTMCLLSFVSCDEVSCWSSAISQNDEKMLRKYNLSFEIMCIQVFDFPVLKSLFFTWTTESTSSTSTIWWLTSCKFSFWVQKHLTASLSAGMDGQVVWMADGAFGACLALYRRQRYWRPLCYAMVFQFPWCRLRWEVQQGAGYRVFVSFPSVKCQDVSWSFMLFHVAAVGFWRLLRCNSPQDFFAKWLPKRLGHCLFVAGLWTCVWLLGTWPLGRPLSEGWRFFLPVTIACRAGFTIAWTFFTNFNHSHWWNEFLAMNPNRTYPVLSQVMAFLLGGRHRFNEMLFHDLHHAFPNAVGALSQRGRFHGWEKVHDAAVDVLSRGLFLPQKDGNQEPPMQKIQQKRSLLVKSEGNAVHLSNWSWWKNHKAKIDRLCEFPFGIDFRANCLTVDAHWQTGAVQIFRLPFCETKSSLSFAASVANFREPSDSNQM